MSNTASYLDKVFVVADPDCRVRQANDLMAYEQAGQDFKKIAQGTEVRISEIRIVPVGSTGTLIFGLANTSDGAPIGWTSTRNFKGKFVNETVGLVEPEAGAGQYGPNAAWAKGKYIGQKTLVSIVDVDLEVERITIETLDPYLQLVEAARGKQVDVAIKSAFRSYNEQKVLYDGRVHRLPGFNRAARPGSSNHQNGIAFDIAVVGGAGHPVYDWLVRNAPQKGFIRTVDKEPWHWEYRPKEAAKAVAAHTFKTANVVT